ncbi:hypothetical protein HAX54_011214 [Datura stramonium]|uniref:Uncharacterized protein n=1 Tax=Datura stramonium TaxID=4076 RepID=A0ABS8TJ19_DATST|nr:hypothetical protein [Datura stramonium]
MAAMMKNGSADSFPMKFSVANALICLILFRWCDWTEREVAAMTKNGIILRCHNCELLMGASRVLSRFDSSTTYQIIKYFKHTTCVRAKSFIRVPVKVHLSSLNLWEVPLGKNVADFLQECIGTELAIPFDKRDNHPTLSSSNYGIPASPLESIIWVAATYYVVGFDPQITRCFRQFLLYLSLHQMSIGFFPRDGSTELRNMIVAIALDLCNVDSHGSRRICSFKRSFTLQFGSSMILFTSL